MFICEPKQTATRRRQFGGRVSGAPVILTVLT